jgi:ribosome-associated protein
MAQLQTPRGIPIPEEAVRVSFTRSGGPGGQHVNTSATRAQVTIDLAACQLSDEQLSTLQARFGRELRTSDSSSRSQWRNRAAALSRALEQIDAGLARERTRVATRATRASKRRRLEDKAHRAKLKRNRRASPED